MALSLNVATVVPHTVPHVWHIIVTDSHLEQVGEKNKGWTPLRRRANLHGCVAQSLRRVIVLACHSFFSFKSYFGNMHSILQAKQHFRKSS